MAYAALVVAIAVILLFILYYLRKRPKRFTIGFFHPYANAGGGGERVLWHAVSAILKKWPQTNCVIITGREDKTGQQILDKVTSRFGIDLPREQIQFVFLISRWLVEASTWPRFTLIGQSLGSIFLGIEALVKCRPHVYFDTMGYAFTYPLFNWLCGCRIAAYVHYPVVSTDMLTLVTSGTSTYNNPSYVARSKWLTNLKIRYYQLVALLYGFVGRRAHVVMVNSRWTYAHIQHIWKSSNIEIVYPPCDVETFSRLSPNRSSDDLFQIVSVGQFRPEKDHKKQLQVMEGLLDRAPDSNPLLIMIGSCRDNEDEERVLELKSLADNLGVTNNVEFLVNIPFTDLQAQLCKSTVAIHTMWNEHFGISLVECMAAGCIMVGHRSGGPLSDIITEGRNGFLVDSVEEYVDCLVAVSKMNKKERHDIVAEAKSHVEENFSIECFENGVMKNLQSIIRYYGVQ
jgi:alpha-1,2-mannosyltransferase